LAPPWPAKAILLERRWTATLLTPFLTRGLGIQEVDPLLLLPLGCVPRLLALTEVDLFEFQLRFAASSE
jgi:hypothetical protein